MYFNYNIDRFRISNPTSSYRSFGRVHIFVVNVQSTLKLVFIEYDITNSSWQFMDQSVTKWQFMDRSVTHKILYGLFVKYIYTLYI
jgi:hypothetical protein